MKSLILLILGVVIGVAFTGKLLYHPTLDSYCKTTTVAIQFETHKLREGNAEYTLSCNGKEYKGKVDIVHRYVKVEDKLIRAADFEINGRI